MPEGTAHKLLKEEARRWLETLGHKDIREEFSIKGLGSDGKRRITIDVVALDGEKKAIECGKANGQHWFPDKRRVLKKRGFTVFRFPYLHTWREGIKEDSRGMSFPSG